MPLLRRFVIAQKDFLFHAVSPFKMPLAGVTVTDPTPPLPLPSCVPFVFADNPQTRAYLARLSRPAQTFAGPTAVFTAQDTDLAFPSCVHSFHGKIIEEALPSIGIMANPKYLWESTKLRFAKKTTIKEAILLCLPWHHNFYHWVIDILPRMALCQSLPALQHLPLLIPESSAAYVKETLAQAGLLDRAMFLKDGSYRVRSLHIPSRLSRSGMVSPVAIEWLNSTFSAPPDPAPPHRKLYISRSDAHYHKVSNEADLLPLLAESGFEITTLSRLPATEQIKLFREAKIVAGPHGAGFAHLVFTRPETDFLEFFQDGHFNPCFANICAARNIRYSFLVGESTGMDLRVSPALLRDLLARLP